MLSHPFSIILIQFQTFVIDASVAVISPQTFIFHHEILARYIQIIPDTMNGQQACLKAEIIGCQTQRNVPELFNVLNQFLFAATVLGVISLDELSD